LSVDATFEVIRFQIAPAAGDVAVVELEGRPADAAVLDGRVVLLLEHPAGHLELHPVAEADRTIEPAGPVIAGTGGQALGHPVERGRGKRRAVEAPDRGDAAHDAARAARRGPRRPPIGRARSMRVTRSP